MKRIIVLLAGLVAIAAVPATASAAQPTASAASLPAVVLKMNGHAIHVTGPFKAGAVNVVSKVSDREASPQLVKLAPGVTFRKAFRAVLTHGGDPNALQGLASITFSTTAEKGTSSAQTVLTPGRWVALDTEAGNPTKWPHTIFLVVRAAHRKRLPAPAATVKTIEFGFTGPSTLRSGEVVRWINAGYLVHMVVAIKFKDAADAATATTLLKEGNDNAVMPLATGFSNIVSTFSPGGIVQEKLNLTPGTYVLACFMNTEDGREHTQLGMEKTITVTS